MAKYHINQATGNVAPCNASTRPCPHGGEENHFGSAEDARKAFEERSSKEAPKPVTKRPGVRLERRAEKYVSPKTLAEMPTKVDDETMKNASAYAVVNRVFATVTYEDYDNKEGFQALNDYDGSDYLVTGKKDYIIATSVGAFVKVSYKADVDAQLDDYWEFHPSISASYSYYQNFEDLKADKPSGRDQNVELDDSSVFRTKTYYNGRESGDRPSYDHSSDRDAIAASKRALRDLPKPFQVANLAEVRAFKGKVSAEKISNGKSYYGSENPATRAASVKRKEFPSEAFSKVLKDPSKEVRVALATRDDLDRPTMELLLEDREGENRGWGSLQGSPRTTVIANPKLPVRLQNRILKEGSISDLRALSQNQGLTPANKEKLEAKRSQLGF